MDACLQMFGAYIKAKYMYRQLSYHNGCISTENMLGRERQTFAFHTWLINRNSYTCEYIYIYKHRYRFCVI